MREAGLCFVRLSSKRKGEKRNRRGQRSHNPRFTEALRIVKKLVRTESETPGSPTDKRQRFAGNLGDDIRRMNHYGERALRVIRLRQDWPTMPTTEIAKLVGISKQRAHQILSRAGLATARVRLISPSYCRVCSKEIPRRKYRYSEKRKYCSSACYLADVVRKSQTACRWCGKEFEIRLSQLRRTRGNFCSKSCQGKWLSANYGRPSSRSVREPDYCWD